LGRSVLLLARASATILLLAAMLVAPAGLQATSIVALIDHSQNRLVIAVDCRVKVEGGFLSKCKIIEQPGCVAAIAGLYEEKSVGFDLRKLVEEACNRPGDLRSKAQAFLETARVPYEAAIQHLRESSPAHFAQIAVNLGTEVIFAGVQERHVALMVRGFRADASGKVTAERYDSTEPDIPRIGYFLGVNGHIRAYVKSHPTWAKMGYPKAARKFVEMEIAAHPDLAGFPISELEIDSHGKVFWLRLGACDKPHLD
jgi:hypothetical protein